MIDMEFRSIDAQQNRWRFYAVREIGALFGECCLLVSWGRIGESVQRRVEHFDDLEQLEQRLEQIIAERHQHGYTIFKSTEQGEPTMSHTPSDHARHARAELEVIISALRVDELARLLELGRRLLDTPSTSDDDRRTLAA